MSKIEFFFDCSSPWTYLAFTGVRPLAERCGVEIDWRPILVGGVFNAVNREAYARREAMFNNERQHRYYMKDLADWSRCYEIEIGMPAMHPANAVKVMRGCFVAEEHGVLVPYAQIVFETYWRDLRDIGDDSVVRDIAAAAELGADELFEKIGTQSYKDRLRANTDELIERGGFGSPTMFIEGDDMYFGNDRLALIEARLQRIGV